MVPPEPPEPGFEIVSVSPSLPASVENSNKLTVTFSEDVHEHFVTLGEKLYINGVESYIDGDIIGWDFPDLPGEPYMEADVSPGYTDLIITPPPGEIVPVTSVSLSPT